eukprot:5337152-Amphidinium_carterae.1
MPSPRQKPAVVGHKQYSPDLEPEEFYYSKLLLHMVWREPGDWLQPEDGRSHAAAFQRIAGNKKEYPNFLRSTCFPDMDGTVLAARELQRVQATLYLKSQLQVGNVTDAEKYQGAMRIMSALAERNEGAIEFEIPDTVPSGLASDVFLPVEGGEEAFQALTQSDASEDVKRQRKTMEYIIRRIIAGSAGKDPHTERLRVLMHGAGGCGKSFVLRAAAHKLRESGQGVVIAAFTGAAAFNINGITLHQCCALPVLNNSYGFASDVPPPSGARLANLKLLWSKAKALFIDEISFVSSEMWTCIDKNLRLARDQPAVPFGGVHIVASGDLYQLPPPKGLPIFANVALWTLFELVEMTGNQRAAQDPHWAALLSRVRVGKQTDTDVKTLKARVVRSNRAVRPCPKALHLYATRAAAGVINSEKLNQHIIKTSATQHQCPAEDTYVQDAMPSPVENAYPKSEDTGGLEIIFVVAVGARVMLRHNIDVSDGLCNGAIGTVLDITSVEGGDVSDIWIHFDNKKAGQRWRDAHQSAQGVAVSRTTARFYGKDGRR